MFNLNSRVLIVDDMMTMRKIVVKACKEIGFTNFTEAADGALGWQAIVSGDPAIDLIISDWNMPNCTGVDMLRRIRGDKRFAHLPLILVTAEAEQTQIVEALKAGVNGYVVKPFTSDTLKTQLEKVHQKLQAGGK